MDSNRVYFKFPVVSIIVVMILSFIGCAIAQESEGDKQSIGILESWKGDYPVAELLRLPQGQQALRIGYIADKDVFASVWNAYKPNQAVPVIDFEKDIVVFTRNVDFYNSTSIFQVTLEDGIVEIIATETMSALPVEDYAAMAMAVIPRKGAEAISAGDQIITIENR